MLSLLGLPLTAGFMGKVLVFRPALEPGNYLAVVEGPMGKHALHLTVSEEIIGEEFIAQGQRVTRERAAELVEEGVRVRSRPIHQQTYYDPQIGACVQPQSRPTSYIRLQ